MLIYIKLIDKSKSEFDVDVNSSVLLLKHKIEDKLKIESCIQRLIYNGITLSDEDCLWRYNLKENSVINLIIQMKMGE